MSRTSPPPGSSETRLTEPEREEALKRILRQQRHVQRSIPPGGSTGPDTLETAQDQEEERVWLAIMDHSHDIQLQVEDACHRLAQGGYGRCVDCDARIPPARLNALPFALRCLPCQEQYETAARRTPAAGVAPELWEDSASGVDPADLME